ncbi:MAG: hypothetical protein AB7F43_01280 [Bacteriovoracia bacterium]
MFYALFTLFAFLTVPFSSALAVESQPYFQRIQSRTQESAKQLQKEGILIVKASVFGERTMGEIGSLEKTHGKLVTNGFEEVLVLTNPNAIDEFLQIFANLEFSFSHQLARRFAELKVRRIHFAVGDYTFGIYPLYRRGPEDQKLDVLSPSLIFSDFSAPDTASIRSFIAKLQRVRRFVETRALPLSHVSVLGKLLSSKFRNGFIDAAVIFQASISDDFVSRLPKSWKEGFRLVQEFSKLGYDITFFEDSQKQFAAIVGFDVQEEVVSADEIGAKADELLLDFSVNGQITHFSRTNLQYMAKLMSLLLAAHIEGDRVVRECQTNLREARTRKFRASN